MSATVIECPAPAHLELPDIIEMKTANPRLVELMARVDAEAESDAASVAAFNASL
jgi:hypothetical protein